MADGFSTPLLVWLDPPTGMPRTECLCDARSALAAMHQNGRGSFAIQTQDWHRAVDLLAQATLDPTPPLVEDARLAVKTLAERSGALING